MVSVLSAERLSDFTIAVGNEFDQDSFKPRRFTRCAHVSAAVGQAETRTIQCDVPVVGQYVTIYLNKWDYLTICELEVHGHPIGKKTAYSHCTGTGLGHVRGTGSRLRVLIYCKVFNSPLSYPELGSHSANPDHTPSNHNPDHAQGPKWAPVTVD